MSASPQREDSEKERKITSNSLLCLLPAVLSLPFAKWLLFVANLFWRELFSLRHSYCFHSSDHQGMQSHATWGLIAQNNYWVLSPHNDCFINNSLFKPWLHICFPKELCRGNNSLKLSVLLSCGTGRGCRVAVTGAAGEVAGSVPLHLGAASGHGLVWHSWGAKHSVLEQEWLSSAAQQNLCLTAVEMEGWSWVSNKRERSSHGGVWLH